ncbi:MAG: hypothetical protein PHD46_06805 [Eubacteriales bacterium]|nr:hypothetical protein [Eubacteriales bacterium]
MRIVFKNKSIRVEGHAENPEICTAISTLMAFVECACKNSYTKIVGQDFIEIQWIRNIDEIIFTFKEFAKNLNIKVEEKNE